MTEDEIESITDSMEMSLSKLWKLVNGQRSLVCHSPWGYKQLDMTELLKCTFVGDRESIPRQIDKKSGLPKEEKCVWIFEEEIGFWNSQ